MSNLTGRTRHRVKDSMFHKPVMVLQVEYERVVWQLHQPRRLEKFWRDAKLEDFTEGDGYAIRSTNDN